MYHRFIGLLSLLLFSCQNTSSSTKESLTSFEPQYGGTERFVTFSLTRPNGTCWYRARVKKALLKVYADNPASSVNELLHPAIRLSEKVLSDDFLASQLSKQSQWNAQLNFLPHFNAVGIRVSESLCAFVQSEEVTELRKKLGPCQLFSIERANKITTLTRNKETKEDSFQKQPTEMRSDFIDELENAARSIVASGDECPEKLY